MGLLTPATRSAYGGRTDRMNARISPNPDYGMRTRHGDRAVHAIVQHAIHNSWTWRRTWQALHELKQKPGTNEATDPAVRNGVYEAISKAIPGWADLNPFWF